MRQKCFISLILISISITVGAQSSIPEIENDILYGHYALAIEKAESELKLKPDPKVKFQLYELIAEAHINLGELPDYLVCVKQSVKNNPNTTTKNILFKTHLVQYYQHMLMVDSATFYAQSSINDLREIGYDYNSKLTSLVLSNYANAMRNGSAYSNIIANALNDFESRNNFLKAYLDTALIYATSDKERADIYLKIGTMYSDYSAHYPNNLDESCKSAANFSIIYLFKSINLEKSNAKKAQGYALIGLNQYYIGEYIEAEKTYQTALKLTENNSQIVYPKTYLSIANWSGSNFEKLYEKTKEVKYLHLAHQRYQKGIKKWQLITSQTSVSGYNDAYHISTINRLTPNCIALFEIAHDSSYIFEAFEYADLTKYPNFLPNNVSIIDVQSKLKLDEAFVHYSYVARPEGYFIFIIMKNDFKFVKLTNQLADLNSGKLNLLYDFSNIQQFKKWSHLFYTNYFKSVDSVLTELNISKAIISNADKCSMLNLDVIISDTLSNDWKNQPYLFHKYNFSYALSARSFVESRSKDNVNGAFNVTLGSYTDISNLRFSKKLNKSILNHYTSRSMEINDNLKKSSVSLVLSHGIGSYNNQSAEINTSSSNTLTVSDVLSMELSNDLVMFMACNTNASQQYYSEGATGNFAKAFRYSGSKSVLTTSWSIDDKSNAFIIERFIYYLSEGIPKNDALWQSKIDYWNQCEMDEEFSPLYWAPYVLTGNTEPVRIEKKETVNQNWLWLLILLPIGYITWRKFS